MNPRSTFCLFLLLTAFSVVLFDCKKKEEPAPRDCALVNVPSSVACDFAFETALTIDGTVLLDEANNSLILSVRPQPPTATVFPVYVYNYVEHTLLFKNLKGNYYPLIAISLNRTPTRSELYVPNGNGILIYDARTLEKVDEIANIGPASAGVLSCYAQGDLLLVSLCDVESKLITLNRATHQVIDEIAAPNCPESSWFATPDTLHAIAVPRNTSNTLTRYCRLSPGGVFFDQQTIAPGTPQAIAGKIDYLPKQRMLIDLLQDNLLVFNLDEASGKFAENTSIAPIKANDWIFSAQQDTLYVASRDWYLEKYAVPAFNLLERTKLPREPNYLFRLGDQFLAVYLIKSTDKTEVFFSTFK